jgi:hypothetical protein
MAATIIKPDHLGTLLHINSGMSKRTFYSKIYRPDVRARPHLSPGRDFTRRRYLLSALVKIRPRGRTLVSARTREGGGGRGGGGNECVCTNAARVRADVLIPSPSSPPSRALPAPLPADAICCPCGRAASARTRKRTLEKIK